MIEALQTYSPNVLIISFTLLFALVLITVMCAFIWVTRSQKLPQATHFDNLNELVAQKEAVLSEKNEAIREADTKISKRDRLIAEVAALDERLENFRMEYDQQIEARAEIEELKRAAAEAAGEYATQTQNLEDQRNEFENLSRKKAHLENLPEDVAQLKEEAERLQTSVDVLRSETGALINQKEEMGALDARKVVLESDIVKLKTVLKEHTEDHVAAKKMQENIAALRNSKDGVQDELDRLVSRRERLAADVKKLEATSSDSASSSTGEAMLADLQIVPEILNRPSGLRSKPREEGEALLGVSKYLKALGLHYSPRVQRAFHTALKINDYAQLTVLSGVSGTGKSQLPRRYAEAMGMHFLQISVEPRWDSPQDLLGFYNYIEKRYRATDLARALVQMDPFDTAKLSQKDNEDQMLLVLLDEMNLARVEYYFSDFLSRLESRPHYNDVNNPNKRIDAEFQIDIRSAVLKTLSVFPGHNVLFTGTMNDDESTQSLSDKVLDRSNVLQFSAPTSFETPNTGISVDLPNDGQKFSEWRKWVKSSSDLKGTLKSQADTSIEKLAKIMEGCGRPFGHRLYDSMIAYVANYPSEVYSAETVKDALADQIEFRIMPKIRGIDVEINDRFLRELSDLVRNDLGDVKFAERIEEMLDRSQDTGLFLWHGLSRDGV